MSNNSEYTREYIDNVNEYFNAIERKLLVPAREKTLTFQMVEELFKRFGEADTMREYLIDNATSAEYYQEQVTELENSISDKERDIDAVNDDLKDVIGDLEDIDIESVTENQIKDIISSLEDVEKRLDKLGR